MTKTELSLLATTLAVGILCSGCGETLAQGIAGQTVQNLAIYEAEVTRKIDAERGFYRSQIENLSQSLAPTKAIDTRYPDGRQVLPQTAGESIPVEQTLIYGRIMTDAEGEAIGVAEALAERKRRASAAQATEAMRDDTAEIVNVLAEIAAGGEANEGEGEAAGEGEEAETTAKPPEVKIDLRADMTTYLYDGVREQIEFQRELRSRQARLTGEFNQNLAKLDGQKSKVAALRKELMKLERPVDSSERFKQLIEIGRAIQEQIRAGNDAGSGDS